MDHAIVSRLYLVREVKLAHLAGSFGKSGVSRLDLIEPWTLSTIPFLSSVGFPIFPGSYQYISLSSNVCLLFSCEKYIHVTIL